MPISRSDIEAARARIESYVRRTPVLEVDGEALGLEYPVILKLELLQHTGSFKPRGAFNGLLTNEIPPAGVVAASGGNHGAALAYAASKLGHPATVFMSANAEEVKVLRVRGFGAEVVLKGHEVSETFAASRDFAVETGAIMIHPFDQIGTVTGQGTLGAEIADQVADLDVLLVSVGGGGLIGGIAAWFGDRIKIVAVESEGTRSLAAALSEGPDAEIEVSGIAASSLGAPRIGEISYGIVRDRIERAVVVSDDDIIEAQRRLWDSARLIAEPGGATALAALTSGSYQPAAGERVVVLVCGGNADPNWFAHDRARRKEPPG